MNNDDMNYLYGNSEEVTTTSEETSEEVTTTSEEITEEISEEVTTVIDNSEIVTLLESQNLLLMNLYDVSLYIFIVLLFILFRTYVLHIFDMIRNMGKE